MRAAQSWCVRLLVLGTALAPISSVEAAPSDAGGEADRQAAEENPGAQEEQEEGTEEEPARAQEEQQGTEEEPAGAQDEQKEGTDEKPARTDEEAPTESAASSAEEAAPEGAAEAPGSGKDASEPRSTESEPPPLTGPASEARESAASGSAEPGPTKSGRKDDSGRTRGADEGEAPGGYSPRAPSDVNLVQEEERASDFLVGALIEASAAFGESADFAGSFGVQGFGIDVRYRGLAPWRFGVSIAWHSLVQDTVDSIQWGSGGAYTGTMIKELSFTPILAKVGYSFARERRLEPTGPRSPMDKEGDENGGGKQIVPYAALGLGASRVARRADVGIVGLIADSWHFAVAGELGAEIPVGPVKLLAAGRLNFLMPSEGISEQIYMNLCLGVGFD